MNKCWYSYGNVFKVKIRKHYCWKCGEKLMVVNHKKVVDQKSEEAKYYDFNASGYGAAMVWPCEFVHKIFFCPQCSANIEFITQINQEDIDIIIHRVVGHFKKINREISILKSFETTHEGLQENEFCLNDDIILCLRILETNKEQKIYRTQISRKNFWERPYYFDITKKKLIDFIK